MPGINCLICLQGISEKTRQDIDLYQNERTGLFPHFTFNTLYSSREVLIGSEQHLHYRIDNREEGDWQVFHECQTTYTFLDRVISLLQNIDLENRAESHMQEMWNKYLGDVPDSFFFICINSRRKLLLFANDALARLPVYWYQNANEFILTRDFGFIKLLHGELSPSPLYMALYATFAYIPGHGSYFQEVDTLPGATIGIYSWQNKDLQMTSNSNYRFPDKIHKDNEKDRLQMLAEVFRSAMIRQCSTSKIILSLSGGYDSRAIIAALSNMNIPYSPVTYRDADGTAEDDLPVASRICAQVKLAHAVIPLDVMDIGACRKLFTLKHGLNYFGVAFLINYLQQLTQSLTTPHVFITGDGGDKVLPCLLPTTKLNSAIDTLQYLYRHNCHIPLKMTCQWFGVNISNVDNYLLELLSSYGTSNHGEQYKRFLLIERAGRWLFEGEDRNRSFIRSETPFYDLEFYRHAMQIPDEWKKDKLFYAKLIRYLSPQLSKINIAGSMETPYLISHKGFSQLLSAYRRIRYEYLPSQEKKPDIGFTSRAWITSKINIYMFNRLHTGKLPYSEFYIPEKQLNSFNRTQLYIAYTLLAIITDSV